ncbi:M28 family peptidase [Paenibacillus albus]|uniref:M28 family peptidase n=1 Tax=Paenibacillus albus TaxID=2495582 RepID=UPI0013E0C6FA|nr:M28 family peptidase [Paenibacillus albus]
MLAALLLAGTITVPSVFAEGSSEFTLKEGDPGYYALQTMQYLSSTIGTRVSGSEGEAKAGVFILQEFGKIGLSAQMQPFDYTNEDGQTVHSANVVATLPGKSSRVLYVGAHYDSVDVSKGADDNASGVSVMLEAAKAVLKSDVPYTMKFLAFGSEEAGLVGSNYYVSQLSPEEIGNAVAMINLDSLAVGDHMHIYGNSGTDGFVRELGLDIADRLNLNITTQTGLNPLYPAGTTIDASDHVAFKYAGIPYGYLEATNWELGLKDGYTQTEKDGEIWHTPKDTLDYIATNYPGRIEEHLSSFTRLLTQLLLEMKEPPKGLPFTDISATPWAIHAIESLASKDIVLGDSDNSFHPRQQVTRAEFVAMLARGLGLLDPTATVQFADVSPQAWYFPYIASLAKWKLVQGSGNGTFNPNAPITREQMAVLAANVLEAYEEISKAEDPETALAKYKDRLSIAGYAQSAVALVTEQQIMQGMQGSLFAPREAVTRAEAAVMLQNLLYPQ